MVVSGVQIRGSLRSIGCGSLTLGVEFPDVLLVCFRELLPLAQSAEGDGVVLGFDGGESVGGEGESIVVHDGVIVVQQALGGAFFGRQHFEIT